MRDPIILSPYQVPLILGNSEIPFPIEIPAWYLGASKYQGPNMDLK